jgi:hypothetical protein
VIIAIILGIAVFVSLLLYPYTKDDWF